jgi:hypothetical protein
MESREVKALATRPRIMTRGPFRLSDEMAKLKPVNTATKASAR